MLRLGKGHPKFEVFDMNLPFVYMRLTELLKLLGTVRPDCDACLPPSVVVLDSLKFVAISSKSILCNYVTRGETMREY